MRRVISNSVVLYEDNCMYPTEVIEEEFEPFTGILDADGEPIMKEKPKLGFDI